MKVYLIMIINPILQTLYIINQDFTLVHQPQTIMIANFPKISPLKSIFTCFFSTQKTTGKHFIRNYEQTKILTAMKSPLSPSSLLLNSINKLNGHYALAKSATPFYSFSSNDKHNDLSSEQQKQQQQQNQQVKLNNKTNNQTDKTGPLKPQDIPVQNLQVVPTVQEIDGQNVEVFHAKGTLSILDKVPGVKPLSQTGQLYVLMFTCGQCNTKQIRSFTKHAYHNGVVLARCGGCEKIHLVADNIGWFEDQPVNVETLHKDVKKVKDQQAIGMFLKKAFEEEQTLLKSNKQSQKQTLEKKQQSNQ